VKAASLHSVVSTFRRAVFGRAVLIVAPTWAVYPGLVFRVAASWGRRPSTALVPGVVVSAVLFAATHGSTDIWPNLYYLTIGVTFALITWRTGGLETSVVLHGANNTFAFLVVLVLHTGLTTGTDRSAGVGSAIFLMPCVLLAIITAVIWCHTAAPAPRAPRT